MAQNNLPNIKETQGKNDKVRQAAGDVQSRIDSALRNQGAEPSFQLFAKWGAVAPTLQIDDLINQIDERAKSRDPYCFNPYLYEIFRDIANLAILAMASCLYYEQPAGQPEA